jgi:V/A-type H+-transporting ATPase subunit I
VDDLPIGPRLEDIPVVLKNPAFAKPFEVLLKVFPPPTYGTLDPTVINAIGVPFFFGLIVGDVAYGLVILALALWLRWRYRASETIRAVGAIGSYCALSTILFGFLYGEVLGTLGPYFGLTALIHRESPEELILLLQLAVCVGAVHVAAGLALGALNARHVLDRHAFMERLGQILCLVSAGFLVAGVLWGSGLFFAAAGACFLPGIGILLLGAGVVGLLEVFSLISNILSYSRLMALGVASVVLAMVANRIFQQLDYGLTGLLAATLLHGLNLLIAMFSPTIHTLRLHYVEFFTKFYRPGGKGYVPFGVRAGVH